MQPVKKILIVCLVSWLIPSATLTPVATAAEGVPVVRSELIRDFARITFEWPHYAKLDTDQKGKVLTLHFNRRIEPDMESALPRLSPYVSEITLTADRKRLVIKLKEPYRTRSFVSDTINGVDILGVDPAAKVAGKPRLIVEKQAPATTLLADNAAKEVILIRQAEALAALEPAASAEDAAASLATPTGPIETAQIEKATVVPTVESPPQNTNSDDRDEAPAPEPETAITPITPPATGTTAVTPTPEAAAPPPALEPDATVKEAVKEAIDDAPKVPEEPTLTLPQIAAPAVDTSKREELEESIKELKDDATTPTTTTPTLPPPEAVIEEAVKEVIDDTPPAVELAPTPTAVIEEPATSPETLAEPPPPVDPTLGDNAFEIPEGLSEEADALDQQANIDDTPEETRNLDEPVKVFAEVRAASTVVRFAWQERVAAASFIRYGHLWVVFSKKVELNLDALKETATDFYPRVSIDDTYKNATVVRIAVPDSSGVAVRGGSESYEWNIMLLGSPQAPLSPLDLTVNTSPPLKPHVFVELEEADKPVNLSDPYVGDDFTAVPLYRPAQGIFPKRRFVDFNLLPTAQGIVIQKIADDVQVTSVQNGLRIGTRSGAHLSSDLPLAELSTEKTSEKLPVTAQTSLFDMAALQSKSNKPFLKAVNEMETELSVIEDQETQNRLRLDIAKMFLSAGFAAESIGVLEELRRLQPEFYIANLGSAYAGAASFLLYRFEDSADYFAAAELQGNPEITYWRRLVAELLGAETGEYDFLNHQQAYLSQYPLPLQQHVSLLAADRAVATGSYNQALQILEAVNKEGDNSEIDSYVSYLLARIAVETGKTKQGLSEWQELASDYNSPFVRARAEFSLVRHEIIHNRPTDITPLVNRLQRLHYSWRGDNLELEILKLLAELQIQNNQPLEAMKTWRALITNFANTPEAAQALSRMRAQFVEIFNGNLIDDLSAFDQLALYYEFRSLTPPGEAGDRIVDSIADKLVSLNMLDQAITLLNYRMRYLYEKSARSRVGAKLAHIYLIDRKPDEALAALTDSVYGNNPSELQMLRDQIAADAMAEKGQYKEALALIETDTGKAANMIRQRIFWKQKEWLLLIASIEAQLQQRKVADLPLTSEETESLIRLAIAYRQVEDNEQLRYLRDYFIPLMPDNTRKKLFAFLTEPDVPLTPYTYETVIAQIEQSREFVDGYTVADYAPDPILGGMEPSPAKSDEPAPASASTPEL